MEDGVTNRVRYQPQTQVTVISGFKGCQFPFDPSHVTTWFQHFECVLMINRIPKELQYDHLMASLPLSALGPISTQLKKPPTNEEERYNWLKNLLINAHGKSKQERLRQFLSGEKIGDQKPSQFLERLQEIAPEEVGDDIIKEVWWRELSSSCRVIMSTMVNESLEQLATVADAVYKEITESKVATITHVPPKSELSELKMLVEQLCSEVRELRSSSRSKSSSLHHNSPTKIRETDSTKVCEFHKKYGNQSRRCRSPCRKSKRLIREDSVKNQFGTRIRDKKGQVF